MTIERHKRNNIGTDNGTTEELLDDGISIGMRSINHMQNNSIFVDSETFSQDERSEVRVNLKRQSEKTTDKTQEGVAFYHNGGPTTRRKEQQISQSNIRSSYYEKSVSELTTIKKFDEFYKERRNVENEMYLWRAPRVSRDLYQVPVENFDTQKSKIEKINYLGNNLKDKSNITLTYENENQAEFTGIFLVFIQIKIF